MKDQNRAPLAEAVLAQNQMENTSFHVPGHKGRAGLFPEADMLLGENIFLSDYTEIPGLDVLHAPSGVIREAEDLAADLFGADRTWFLVNGTSSGVAAALASVSDENGTVLVERACHTSVTSGLVLSGATPYYLPEAFDEETGLMAGVSLESVRYAFANCINVQAIVLTHPSYYGTYSDLQAITELAHKNGAAVIVDEAHGPQLMFTGQGIPSAMECGADISVQSTHKMLGSLTQTAMLHMQGNIADPRRMQYFINIATTTSPSYPLMVSLDSVRKTMASEGKKIWTESRERVEQAEKTINRIPGMCCTTHFKNADGKLQSIEKSRFLIDAVELGISGTSLSELLRDRFHIDVEFADPMRAVLVTGSGTSDSHIKQLTEALKTISDEARTINPESVNIEAIRRHAAGLFNIPVRVETTPREAVMAQMEILEPEEAEGSVSAVNVAVYPPGIPVLRPGERITREIIEYIIFAREAGLEVHGLIEEQSGFRLAAAQDRRKTMQLYGYF